MQVATVHQIQAMVRARRTDLGLSQESLARSAGVSRKWLSEFERGITTAVELPLVLGVVAALGLVVEIRVSGPTVDAPTIAVNDQLDLDAFLADYVSRDGA